PTTTNNSYQMVVNVEFFKQLHGCNAFAHCPRNGQEGAARVLPPRRSCCRHQCIRGALPARPMPSQYTGVHTDTRENPEKFGGMYVAVPQQNASWPGCRPGPARAA